MVATAESQGTTVEFLLLFALIMLNGLFAMSEIAIVTSRQARLQQRIERGSAGAAMALQLLDRPGPFLSTVQVGITTIGILSGAFGESAIADRLREVFAAQPLLAPYSQSLALVVMVLLVTYFAVVIGELVPKRLALINPERIASIAARPMHLLSRLAHPLVVLFDQSSNLLLRLLGASGQVETPVSEEEVRILLRQGTAAGVFAASEQAMVDNVFRLDDLRVTDIMTPGRDVLFLDLDDSPDCVRDKLLTARFEAMPLCRGGLDNVLGMVDAKRLLALTVRDGKPAALEESAMSALFVPAAITAAQLLAKLQKRNRHIALVVDEYGELLGLVTITDVMKAIIGHVPGHEQDASEAAVQRADGSWLLDGTLLLDQVWPRLQVEPSLIGDSSHYRTVGGFVLERLGRVPRSGESFAHAGWTFEVVDMDGNRIDRLLVSPQRA